MERTRNAIRNIIWGYVYKIITLIMPFIIRTLLIRILGSQYLGLNSLFISILDILNLAELGFGSAMAYSLYKPIAENKTDEICALLALYRRVYNIIGVFILCIGIVIMPFLKNFIANDYPKEINIYILYIYYLAYTVIGYLMSAYKASLFEANQRADISNKINSVILLIRYGVQIFILIYLKNYYLYIIMLPIFQVITNIVALIILKKMYPNIKSQGKVDEIQKEDIKKKVISLIGHKISDKALFSVNNIIVSSFLGLSILAYFDNYNYIVTAVGGMLLIIYNAMLAGIGNSIVVHDVDKNFSDFNKITFLNNWLVGWCTICLLSLYQPFINLWVGERYMLSNFLVILFSIYFYSFYIRRIVLTYKDALGMWDKDALKPYVIIVVNILLAIILVKKIGLAGALITPIVVNIFIAIPWETVVLFKYYFGIEKLMEYVIKQIKWTILIIFLSIFTLIVINLFNINYEIGELFLRVFILCTLPNMLLIMISYNKEEFKQCKNMFINIMQKGIK